MWKENHSAKQTPKIIFFGLCVVLLLKLPRTLLVLQSCHVSDSCSACDPRNPGCFVAERAVVSPAQGSWADSEGQMRVDHGIDHIMLWQLGGKRPSGPVSTSHNPTRHSSRITLSKSLHRDLGAISPQKRLVPAHGFRSRSLHSSDHLIQ